MRVDVTMPQLGETVSEGTVVRWLRSPGESITEREPLLEIATDKVDTEIPAPATGVLAEIVVHEQSTVAVGTVLAVISSENELGLRRRHLHSPRVRKRARDAGVTLESIRGSGPNGRVTNFDLQTAIATASSDSITEELSATPARGNEHRAATASIVEADVTELASFCRSAPWNNVEVAFMAHLVHAVVAELQGHPSLNATLPADATHNNRVEVNVGIPFATLRGTVVTVVRNASELNAQGIARRLDDLAKAAHTKTISSLSSAGATFTVADAGSRSLLVEIPPLSPGQHAALAVGAIVERPVVMRDRAGAALIAVRSTSLLSLSYDPDRISAADAAQFLSGVKERLQRSPASKS